MGSVFGPKVYGLLARKSARRAASSNHNASMAGSGSGSRPSIFDNKPAPPTGNQGAPPASALRPRSSSISAAPVRSLAVTNSSSFNQSNGLKSAAVSPRKSIGPSFLTPAVATFSSKTSTASEKVEPDGRADKSPAQANAHIHRYASRSSNSQSGVSSTQTESSRPGLGPRTPGVTGRHSPTHSQSSQMMMMIQLPAQAIKAEETSVTTETTALVSPVIIVSAPTVEHRLPPASDSAIIDIGNTSTVPSILSQSPPSSPEATLPHTHPLTVSSSSKSRRPVKFHYPS